MKLQDLWRGKPH